MRLHDLSPAQRADIGRALYQDRQAGMTWEHAGEVHLRRFLTPSVRAHEPAHRLARDYALNAGLPWPAPVPAGPLPVTPPSITERVRLAASMDLAARRWRTHRHFADVIAHLAISCETVAILAEIQTRVVARYAKGARTKERTIRCIWHALDGAIERYQTRRDWLESLAA